MKPLVYMMRQDDPFKCTAAKLVKFRLVEPVRTIRSNWIVLNPYASDFLLKSDATVADYICAIDCSWEKADGEFKHQRIIAGGIGRKLPPLLAANPINYSKLGKLSSAEALAGALYILGQKDQAAELMDKFKWGHTFLELNANLLEDYAQAQKQQEIPEIVVQYFPNLS